MPQIDVDKNNNNTTQTSAKQNLRKMYQNYLDKSNKWDCMGYYVNYCPHTKDLCIVIEGMYYLSEINRVWSRVKKSNLKSPLFSKMCTFLSHTFETKNCHWLLDNVHSIEFGWFSHLNCVRKQSSANALFKDAMSVKFDQICWHLLTILKQWILLL